MRCPRSLFPLVVCFSLLSACASVEAPPYCAAWEDWRKWQFTSGPQAAAPTLRLSTDACGHQTILRVDFAEPGQLTITRPLAASSSVGLSLDTSCTGASYNLGELRAAVRQGSAYYQAELTGTAALALRATIPCTFQAQVEVLGRR